MDKFKKMLKKLKVQSLLVAAALIVIGLLFIIFPDSSAMVICYFAGAVLALWGAILLVSYFSAGIREFGSGDLATGVALVCAALLLFIKPGLIAEFLTVVFGIALIVDGAVKLQNAADMAKLKMKTGWAVTAIAIITFTLGAILAFNPFSSHNALMIFAGAALIVTGAMDIVAAGFVRKFDKRVEERNSVIDLDDDDIRRENEE